MKAIILSLVVILFSLNAHSCSCVPPPPPAEALKQSDAVFVGKVISSKKIYEKNSGDAEPFFKSVEYTLEVLQVFKGRKIKKKVTVTTNSSSAACGYAFNEGEEYIVYAQNVRLGGLFRRTKVGTSLCSRTKPNDLKEAEALNAAVAKG